MARGATAATWYVDDAIEVMRRLAARGVHPMRYDGLVFDTDGVTDRAGGGLIAWFADPDGNTFAVESDA